MAKFIQKLKALLMYVWDFRTNLRLKSINKKLGREVVKQEINRKEFLHEFRFYLRKYLRRDASGKYIPLKGKNPAEIHAAVYAKYGKELEALNLTFTKSLQLK